MMHLKFYPVVAMTGLAIVTTFPAFCQVSPPATLNFSEDDPTNWADGIVEDGEGGSVDIDGITLQIFPATSGFSLYPDYTMEWHDVGFWSTSGPTFTGITPGPADDMTFSGVPAMVIKSRDPAVNFSLSAITMLDWGGVSPVMDTYDDGAFVGTISPVLPTDGTVVTLTSADDLLPSVFGNIDEIRMYPQGGGSAFWIGFNDLTIDDIALPVTWSRFDGALLPGNKVQLNWATGMEQNASGFEIEQSTNAHDFLPVGFVPARGEAEGVFQYQYVAPAINTVTYFRLKQIDIDGKFTYSTTLRMVPAGAAVPSKVYPSPARGIVYLEAAEGEKYSVINALGQVLKSSVIQSKKETVNIAGFVPGSYYFRLGEGAGSEVYPFVVE